MHALTLNDSVTLLKGLVRIPSLSGQEQNIADFLNIQCCDIFSSQCVQRDGNSILIHLGPSNAKHTLLLCSHIDTVSPSQGWTRDPFSGEEDNGKIFGLGANDALASCVSMLAAASRIQNIIKGNTSVILALVEQEEAGDQGFCRIESKLNYTSAIFGEPTGMRPATSMRGYMRLKLIGTGKSCHASRPWEGQNAISDLSAQLQRIQTLKLSDNSAWGQATIQPTILKAGSSHNQIPDYAEAILDIRPTPEITNDKILAFLTEQKCRFEIIHNKRKPMQCRENSEIIRVISDTLPDVETYTFGGTCDMAFATQPSIIMGPGHSARSHSTDEYIEIRELDHAAHIYQNCLTHFIQIFS